MIPEVAPILGVDAIDEACPLGKIGHRRDDLHSQHFLGSFTIPVVALIDYLPAGRGGFAVRREVLYQALPAVALSPATTAALLAGEVGAVLLYSPRTARALAKLLSAAGLAASCRGVSAVCLSDAVSSAAVETGLTWKALRVAARPDQDALLAALAA